MAALAWALAYWPAQVVQVGSRKIRAPALFTCAGSRLLYSDGVGRKPANDKGVHMSGLYDDDGIDGPWIKHMESQINEVAARPTVCCVRIVAERVTDGKMWRADLGELPSMKTVYTPKAMVWASSATKLDAKKAKAWCALQPQDDGCSKWVTVSVRAEEMNPLEVAKSKAMKMRKLRPSS